MDYEELQELSYNQLRSRNPRDGASSRRANRGHGSPHYTSRPAVEADTVQEHEYLRAHTGTGGQAGTPTPGTRGGKGRGGSRVGTVGQRKNLSSSMRNKPPSSEQSRYRAYRSRNRRGHDEAEVEDRAPTRGRAQTARSRDHASRTRGTRERERTASRVGVDIPQRPAAVAERVERLHRSRALEMEREREGARRSRSRSRGAVRGQREREAPRQQSPFRGAPLRSVSHGTHGTREAQAPPSLSQSQSRVSVQRGRQEAEGVEEQGQQYPAPQRQTPHTGDTLRTLLEQCQQEIRDVGSVRQGLVQLSQRLQRSEGALASRVAEIAKLHVSASRQLHAQATLLEQKNREAFQMINHERETRMYVEGLFRESRTFSVVSDPAPTGGQMGSGVDDNMERRRDLEEEEELLPGASISRSLYHERETDPRGSFISPPAPVREVGGEGTVH
ncbi:hypothetical protein KIPB_009669 [Kipferlia bialata]|uniref:Uncharacterized protein n=1 Tax=Kipferlia bialata TaxID=797122 RepID=A0A9K3GLQ8_9EUKA|nr:hypothetical protein KIPB_009669 [Kipferlia bialata]|eukprot:g9669.t1